LRRETRIPAAKLAGVTAGLTRAQIAKLADDIRGVLADPGADLTRDARLRWEGALTALDLVLGNESTLPPELGHTNP
jgi:hypothetical protein